MVGTMFARVLLVGIKIAGNGCRKQRHQNKKAFHKQILYWFEAKVELLIRVSKLHEDKIKTGLST